MLLSAPAAWGESLRWPEPAREPQLALTVLQRAPAVQAYLMAIGDRQSNRRSCDAGRICVICLAGCDHSGPEVIHSMAPRPTGPKAVADGGDNDADGIADSAPRFARQEWAGIVCGWEGGCSGASIPPPRPSEITITVHRYKH
jgi:hypothetical protein